MARRSPGGMELMHPGSLLMLGIRLIQFILAVAALGVTGSLMSAVKSYFQYLEFDDDYGYAHNCSVPGRFDFNIFCVRMIVPSQSRSHRLIIISGCDHHPGTNLPRRVGQTSLPHPAGQVLAPCHRRLFVPLLAHSSCHSLESIFRRSLRHLWIQILPRFLR